MISVMWSVRKVTMLLVYFDSVFWRIQWIVHFIWNNRPSLTEIRWSVWCEATAKLQCFLFILTVFCRIQWIVHFIWRREPVDSEKGEKGGTSYYLSWGGGGRGIRGIFIMSRQDLPDNPPMKICNILMLPPHPPPPHGCNTCLMQEVSLY